MPSFVTHAYFADRVKQTAPSALAKVCDAAPEAYLWGCQGPDPLFFYHVPFGRLPFSGAVSAVGSRLHREGVGEAFRAMAAQVDSHADALAYLLGFCTHYALDRAVHPYIEDQTRLLMSVYGLGNSSAHRLCETDLDSAILKENTDAAPASCKAYRLLDANTRSRDAIARLLSAAGQAIGCGLTPRETKDALASMAFVYRGLHYGGMPLRTTLALCEKPIAEKGALSSLVRRNRLLPEDGLNQGHRIWLDWEGVPHTESFLELLEEQALPSAHELQQAVCAYCRRGRPLPDSLFALDYAGKTLA